MTDAPTEREGEGAWTRLRRRKVVQWSLAYAAAAWTLLQVIEYLGETYSWPPAIRQIVTPALALGSLLVLVLAWYHGDKGDQRVSRPELAILATIVALVGGTLWWYVSRIDERAWVVDTGEPDTRHALPPDAASIAVLPFVDMSPGKDQEYFADGMSEELLNLLAQLPQLRVISRSSAFSYKGKDVKLADVAQELNVAHILEGSVRKAGNQVRITAQLIDARSDTHLWSQTYDRTMDDIFAIQDEIAAAVVEQLKIKLLGTPPKTQATTPEAYALYLQAVYLQRQFTPESLIQAIDLYKRALAVEPNYAQAWLGLANVYLSQANKGLLPVETGFLLARDAIDRALVIDPHLAGANRVLSSIEEANGDFAAEAAHIQRALELDPGDLSSILHAAGLAMLLGRSRQAIELYEFAAVRDPVMPNAHFNLGVAYYCAGRSDDAIASVRRALVLSPGLVSAHYLLGASLLQKGEKDVALKATQEEPSEPWRMIGLVIVYHAMGKRAESNLALEQLISKYGQDWPYNIAYTFAYRGEADRAFDWLNQAVQRKDTGISEISANPLFANIHSDQRWLPFLRSIDMAPEQLDAIKLDVKLPK